MSLQFTEHLDSAWVKHDADGGSHAPGGQVLRELSAHDTAVSVGSANLAPDGLQALLLKQIYESKPSDNFQGMR